MEREKSIATTNNDISFISNPGEINVTAESESLFFTHVCFSCFLFQIEKYFCVLEPRMTDASPISLCSGGVFSGFSVLACSHV